MSRESPINGHAEVYVNSDKVLHWNILNTDETDFMDITGWHFAFGVGVTADGPLLFSKAVVIEDALAGMVRVDLDPVDTASLEPATYHYTLARTDANNSDALADGKFVLKARIV